MRKLRSMSKLACTSLLKSCTRTKTDDIASSHGDRCNFLTLPQKPIYYMNNGIRIKLLQADRKIYDINNRQNITYKDRNFFND